MKFITRKAQINIKMSILINCVTMYSAPLKCIYYQRLPPTFYLVEQNSLLGPDLFNWAKLLAIKYNSRNCYTSYTALRRLFKSHRDLNVNLSYTFLVELQLIRLTVFDVSRAKKEADSTIK